MITRKINWVKFRQENTRHVLLEKHIDISRLPKDTKISIMRKVYQNQNRDFSISNNNE